MVVSQKYVWLRPRSMGMDFVLCTKLMATRKVRPEHFNNILDGILSEP